MKNAVDQPFEAQRLAALEQYQVLDTSPDSELNDICSLASQLCGTSFAALTLIDQARVWFKAKVGFAETEVSRQSSFCDVTLDSEETFVVEDAPRDARFRNHPWVTGSKQIKFYAGAVLRSDAGFAVGTLCVLDRQARHLNPAQLDSLKTLARLVIRNFERQKQMRELNQKSLFLESVLASSPSLVAYLDQNLVYRYANAAFERWFSFRPGEIVGKSLASVVGPDAYARALVLSRRALAGESVRFQQQMPYSAAGHTITKTVSVNLIPDQNNIGVVQGFFSIVIDLTTEFEFRADFETKMREVQRIYDALPIQIGHWSVDGINLSANRAYAASHGLTPETMRGRSATEILNPHDFEMKRPYIDAVKQGVAQEFERSYRTEDGSHKHMLINYLPDRIDGKVTGLFVILTDITQLRNLEEDRRVLEAKMIGSARMAEIGEMAGGMAHEINTPLGIILGRVEIAKIELERETLDRSKLMLQLSKIEVTTERIAKIIRGLRSLSRNSDSDPFIEAKLSPLIFETTELFRERLKKESIRLEISGALQASITCREAQVAQILTNLVNNSIDAISALSQKWIRVDVTMEKDFVFIRVIDSGGGIPRNVRDHLMRPFFTTKEVGKGTGLGLSISSQIALSHGGELYYDEGFTNTCFCLKLPSAPRVSDK